MFGDRKTPAAASNDGSLSDFLLLFLCLRSVFENRRRLERFAVRLRYFNDERRITMNRLHLNRINARRLRNCYNAYMTNNSDSNTDRYYRKDEQ